MSSSRPAAETFPRTLHRPGGGVLRTHSSRNRMAGGTRGITDQCMNDRERNTREAVVPKER